MSADLNTADLGPLLPMPTHAAPVAIEQPNFRFKRGPSPLAHLSPTGMWCEWCQKTNHNDADCWSTRTDF